MAGLGRAHCLSMAPGNTGISARQLDKPHGCRQMCDWVHWTQQGCEQSMMDPWDLRERLHLRLGAAWHLDSATL